MKIRTLALLLAILSALSLSLASCDSSDLNPDDGWVPVGYQLASNENLDYVLYVPEEWVVDMSTGVLAASTRGGNLTMMATSIETGTSLYEFWKEYESQFSPAFVDFAYVTEGKDLLLSGGKVPAKQYVYTATVTGTPYKFMQVIALNNHTAYILTFTAHLDYYDQLIEKVEGVINYMTFDEVDLSGIGNGTGDVESESDPVDSSTDKDPQ